jgi:Zinc knuckle
MVAEQPESMFGTSVRAFMFDGDEAKYRSWEGKTLALAGSTGFLLALTKESAGTTLTAEEYEYGEVEVPGLVMTGGAVGAPTTRSPTSAECRKYLAKTAAWTYLVASCTDKAYALIERCDGDPFKGWTILKEKYCATDAEENYPELDRAFNDCKLVGAQKDPELWFNDMDHLNMRLGRINLKYQKDELQLKSHMMAAMSDDYESVIVKFRGDLNETPLMKLRKEVVLQYKTIIKTGGKAGSESALSANVSEYKGYCAKCGKFGHEANECRSNKSESTEESSNGSGTNQRDKSHVTCYNCQQKGHFANKCTNPRKVALDPTAEMGMFVGTAIMVGPTHEYDTNENILTDSFFDMFDDSMPVEDDGMFCDMVPCGGIDATEVIMMSAVEAAAVITMSDCVESASPVGLTEELLMDSGAMCGVTHDNTQTMNSKPSKETAIKATDNSDLFSETERLKEDSVILLASSVIPYMLESELHDDCGFLTVAELVLLAEDVRAPIVPTGVIPPVRRKWTSSVGKGAFTRSRLYNFKSDDVCHRSDDTEIMGITDTEEMLADIMVTNASLKSEPQIGVSTNDVGWLKSINDESKRLLSSDVFNGMPESFEELHQLEGGNMGNSAVIMLHNDQYGVEESPSRHWSGKLLAIAVVCCDDCILTGRSKWVNHIKVGISGHVKISDLGKLKRHLGADYAYGYDENGLMGNWYDLQTTEDVKIYCATDAVSSATVSDGQYATRDSTSISVGCSVDHELQYGNGVDWTAAATKLIGH